MSKLLDFDKNIYCCRKEDLLTNGKIGVQDSVICKFCGQVFIKNYVTRDDGVVNEILIKW